MKKLLVLISALFLVLGTFGLASAATLSVSPTGSLDVTGDSTIDFNIFLDTAIDEVFETSGWRINMFYDIAELSNPTSTIFTDIFAIGPDPAQVPPLLEGDLRDIYVDFVGTGMSFGAAGCDYFYPANIDYF